MTDLTHILAAIVGGDISAAAALQDIAPDDVRAAADRHGVLPLVAHRLAGSPAIGPTLQRALAAEARLRAAADLLRVHELRRCLNALHREQVPVLVMKGAQLAHTHYERPDLRPRLDSDVLVPPDFRSTVAAVLTKCGHLPAARVPGDLVMYQATYTKHHHGAIVHAIDVHWRTANPQLFGAVLVYEELAKAAVPLPSLGPGARGLASHHALVLACVHRIAHHVDTEYLIWLYDVHLIASRLTAPEWSEVVALACERGVATVCAQGLQQAAVHFHTRIPADVLARLGEASGQPIDAATAAYLTRGRRPVENVLADLRALPSWGIRWRLMREHLFPPSEYMRNVYAPVSAVPLPLLYLQRAVRGARKWLARAQ